ncbi:triacylglycerol lipase 2 isoform X3 [Brachypodium distachyon]|uniref:triacylglycerol lipase 2 isoform X3 n=1 Tax=Brachypodium distachyon TaxID=15368 RepID=UPI000D0D0853|nr:triacylglycerol lipase 2 isoform X3 [Brachypodium distachyon]XP_024313890.1 triacylglycerol lipase 2 isoform X3 [Brachypodium distachyon]|eukprot:XP_024313889.1 triacylglycerol lipase 2 isoform X3 [Brachypodium distachyon]
MVIYLNDAWITCSAERSTGQRCPPSPHPFSMCKSEAAAFGYPCEDHKVTTEDGYILSLKRIPHGRFDTNSTNNTRQPVLLFHGLMVDGVSWLLGTPKQSLGFLLADGGFDVWFANTRGTNTSRNHTSLSPKDPAYWNWTWDEIAAYDLPSVLELVYNHTGGQKVHYIGHSLGTLIILAAFSEHKVLHLVRSAVLLCPIAYLSRTKSKLTRLAAEIFLAEAFHFLGYHEFNPVGPVAHEILIQVCGNPEIDCYDLFSAVAGPDCCLNTSTTCAFLQHAPQSTSIKNLVHLSQMVRHQGIRRYDYGNAKDNMKHYNQPRPPLYNLSSIPTHVPMFLTHGGQDFLGDVPDTRHLLRTLVRSHDSDNIEVLYVPDYAHADFVIGFNAPQLVYAPMVDFFQRH